MGSTIGVQNIAHTNGTVAATVSSGGGVYIKEHVVQVKNFQTGAMDTGTNAMGLDDTIPQKTEGDEFMTLAFTPTNASSKLLIEAISIGSVSKADRYIVMALFQDTTTNALATSAVWEDTLTGMNTLSLRHYMTAGTTSATTFKIRIGSPDSTATYTFNGFSSARKYGGTLASSITITEIGA
jgi:hypothetical protein|tara:strand:- start:60 stop:605 length:546 start_codon:yes stop_codon:yes gene_type:complete